MSGEKEMVRFVFRLDKCDHRPSICLEALSLSEICSRFDLSVSPDRQPLSASELFTESFESEVFPFIGKLLRNRFTKTKFAKLWEAQPVTVRKIYERRAEILLTEWKRLRAARDDAADGAEEDIAAIEAAKLLSESKAKRKERDQRRADLIAQQIAGGLFEEPEAEANAKPETSADTSVQRPKASKAEKAPKKKKVKKKKTKLKKFKGKKVRKDLEIPAAPTQRAPASRTLSPESVLSPERQQRARPQTQSTWPIARPQSASSLEAKTSTSKLVDSELRFRLQILREKTGDDGKLESDAERSEWLEEWMDAAEMHCVRRKVCAELSAVRRMRIWLSLDVDLCALFGTHRMELRTDGDRVALQSVGDAESGDAPVMLFELRWSAFGEGFRERVDVKEIGTAFVKNTRSLRIDIPLRGEIHDADSVATSRCDI